MKWLCVWLSYGFFKRFFCFSGGLKHQRLTSCAKEKKPNETIQMSSEWFEAAETARVQCTHLYIVTNIYKEITLRMRWTVFFPYLRRVEICIGIWCIVCIVVLLLRWYCRSTYSISMSVDCLDSNLFSGDSRQLYTTIRFSWLFESHTG